MAIKRFEDILAWQKARQLTVLTYQSFNHLKDFGFRDQIQRAVISISNNIAEGFERGGNKELRHFLFIAKASCGELRSMIYASSDLKYISHSEMQPLFKLSEEISRMLSAFIKKLD